MGEQGSLFDSTALRRRDLRRMTVVACKLLRDEGYDVRLPRPRVEDEYSPLVNMCKCTVSIDGHQVSVSVDDLKGAFTFSDPETSGLLLAKAIGQNIKKGQ